MAHKDFDVLLAKREPITFSLGESEWTLPNKMSFGISMLIAQYFEDKGLDAANMNLLKLEPSDVKHIFNLALGDEQSVEFTKLGVDEDGYYQLFMWWNQELTRIENEATKSNPKSKAAKNTKATK